MSQSTQKIVVLGGCGFLASHLLRALREALPDAELSALDRVPAVPTDRQCRDVDYSLGADVGDPEILAEQIAGADVVVNTMGLVSFARKAAEELFRVNVDLAVAVAHACIDAPVPWLVHISSVAALGFDASGAEVTEDFEFDWALARRRGKVYMLSKHEGDLLLGAVGGDLVVTTIYPGLLLGPGDPITTPKLAAMARGPVSLTPPGGTNVVDVRDVAQGLATLLCREPMADRFILGGENVTYPELGSRARAGLGIDHPATAGPSVLRAPAVALTALAEALAPGPLPTTTDNVDSSFTLRYFSSERARQTFGYAPRFAIEDSFRDWDASQKGAVSS